LSVAGKIIIGQLLLAYTCSASDRIFPLQEINCLCSGSAMYSERVKISVDKVWKSSLIFIVKWIITFYQVGQEIVDQKDAELCIIVFLSVLMY
jgi:hypothetical protein